MTDQWVDMSPIWYSMMWHDEPDIVQKESEGRGDKIAVLRLMCFFDDSIYPYDETSCFFP